MRQNGCTIVRHPSPGSIYHEQRDEMYRTNLEWHVLRQLPICTSTKTHMCVCSCRILGRMMVKQREWPGSPCIELAERHGLYRNREDTLNDPEAETHGRPQGRKGGEETAWVIS